MRCVPPSKRHALCNANGRSGVFRGADVLRVGSSFVLTYAPQATTPLQTVARMLPFLTCRAHILESVISTPHVGVLITFIGACTPPFRHRKRTATKQRLSAVRRSKPQRDPGIATSGTTPNSAQRQPHRLGSKPRQPQQDARHDRAHAAGTRRSANRSGHSPQRSRNRPSSPPPRQQTNAHNWPLKEGSE